MIISVVLFFFSSRRRHTRLQGDWSSDVCSSDLLVAGMLGGMLWAAIVALLRDRFNANEILVSLMLVYVAVLVLGYLVYGPWKDPKGYNFPQTITFAAPTKVPRLIEGFRINIGVLIAVAT